MDVILNCLEDIQAGDELHSLLLGDFSVTKIDHGVRKATLKFIDSTADGHMAYYMLVGWFAICSTDSNRPKVYRKDKMSARIVDSTLFLKAEEDFSFSPGEQIKVTFYNGTPQVSIIRH